jgi:hypothetical protein
VQCYNSQLQLGSPMQAMPYVLRCQAMCQAMPLDSMSAEVALQLAELHLQMGAPRQAIATVRAVFSHILENCAIPVQVRACLLMAKCLLTMDTTTAAICSSSSGSSSSSSSSSGSSKAAAAEAAVSSAATLREAATLLLQALEQCQRFMCLDMAVEACYLLARVYHELSESRSAAGAKQQQRQQYHCEQRDRVAALFVKYQRLQQKWTPK